nr:immunoglobulin light chain junction region [Macaca mulatta]
CMETLEFPPFTF